MTSTARRTEVIKASEASITTATIEIKALTIGKRQVTQAVFKQFLNGDVLCPKTCELVGTPWGTVNYHGTGDCVLARGEHLHVVWQHEGKL